MFEDALALLIGISDYKNQTEFPPGLEKIKHAHADARYMQKAMLSLGFAEANVICLCNEEATCKGIYDAIDRIWYEVKTAPDCQVILFFAGHAWGTTCLGTPVTHLLPHDAEVEHLTNRISFHRTIDVEFLAKVLNNLLSKHKAMFLDTCYSGGLYRGLMYEQLSKSNMAFIASCGEKEGALEHDGDSNHGLFTIRLVEALCGLGGCDPDGTVSVLQVGHYIQAHVPKDAEVFSHQQNPYVNIQGPPRFPIGKDLSHLIRACLDAADLPHTIQCRF